MLYFHALGVRFRGQDTCLRTVTSFFVSFGSAKIGEQVSCLFGDEGRLSQHTSASFSRSFISYERRGVFFFCSRSRRESRCASGGGSYRPCNQVAGSFLVAFFLAGFLEGFSIRV